MRARPTPEELAASGDYVLLGEFHNDRLMDFVVEYLVRKRSWVVWANFLMTGLAAGLAAGLAIGRGEGVLRTILAFVLAFVTLIVVLLPLHELAHALAYRLIGARDIRWGFSTRMLAVWVTAHRFVAERRPFVLVALAPFLLNVPIAAAAIAWPQWSVYFLFLLAWHVHGASGDFAILNFIWLHRDRGFWTFDDSEAGVSQFYGAA